MPTGGQQPLVGHIKWDITFINIAAALHYILQP